MDSENFDKMLLAIVKEHSSITTLETRKSDSLDFHMLSVWGLKAMLIEAYNLGQSSHVY
jgi:hypothetical protein